MRYATARGMEIIQERLMRHLHFGWLLVLLFPVLALTQTPDDSNPKDRPAPKLNPNKPPGPAPEGMAWIPGGEFWMGMEDKIEAEPDAPPGFDRFKDARHVHKVY